MHGAKRGRGRPKGQAKAADAPTGGGSAALPLTPSEEARKKKILDDKCVLILEEDWNGDSVHCQKCKKRIKLSGKSRWDLEHWKTHKGRCYPEQASKPAKKVGLKKEEEVPRAHSSGSNTPSLIEDEGDNEESPPDNTPTPPPRQLRPDEKWQNWRWEEVKMGRCLVQH